MRYGEEVRLILYLPSTEYVCLHCLYRQMKYRQMKVGGQWQIAFQQRE
jgi:hypothetical protein